jgi:dihydrofolate reductase/thymidylate synthase
MNIIVAKCNNNGIGINNKLPWNLKSELKYFKEITSITKNIKKSNAIIMGRKTYESIGKPLPNRINIVITSKKSLINENKHLFKFSNIDDCLNFILINEYKIEKTYCIGGESIYNLFLPLCTNLYITEIYEKYLCDTYFPEIDNNKFHLLSCSEFKEENNILFRHIIYSSENKNILYANKEECNYLNLMKKILDNGEKRNTRNGFTLSLFGNRLEFDISNHLPLLTTRKIFLRGIIEELLWFIKGDTNSKNLNDKGIKIWNGNSSREYLNSRGLSHLKEGDCGPIYGHQWRHFGSTYTSCDDNYDNKGYDQIKECINLIKNDPTSRRIILNAWNPPDLNNMSLPPCHILYQWYVSNNNELSCQFYQRSSDYFLANNFNIISASILTYMFAHICNLKPKKIIMCIGDTHIYDTHISQCFEQLQRNTLPFPKLIIKNKINNIDDFKYTDFELIGYTFHNSIKANMVV